MDFNLDNFRSVFLKYTRMAYELLPKRDNPIILDVGCGSGQPSMELANLSNGTIIAIDVDKLALEKFHEKLKEFKFKDRISIKQVSLLDNELPESNFDIIWAEGVIHIIGFNKGIKACHKLSKKDGFFVLHETIEGIENNLKLFKSHGFKLVNKIILPDDIWLKEYFNPLEEAIKTININELNHDEVKEIEKAKNEIEWARKATLKDFAVGFYIFRKL